MNKARPRFSSLMVFFLLLVAMLAGPGPAGQAQTNVVFQKPPKEILELVDIKQPPSTRVDPGNRYFVFLRRPSFKSLDELAQKEMRLAGLRINPANFDRARTSYSIELSVQLIGSGQPVPVTGLPAVPRIEYGNFSPRGNYFSFVQAESAGLTLWVVDLKTGQAKPVTPPVLTAVMGWPYVWAADETAVYCRTRADGAILPQETELAEGPSIQEATGAKAPARTYQDLLRNRLDEKKFEYYATSAITRFSLQGKAEPFLPAKIYLSIELSPDGRYFLVDELHPPYSYLFPYHRFPHRVTVVDRTGQLVREICDKPLQDKIPIANDAVETGMRDIQWREDREAVLAWYEAQDEGDPARDVPVRDHVYQLAAPFSGQKQLLCAARDRAVQVSWGGPAEALVYTYWWKTRNIKTYLVNPDQPAAEAKIIFDYSSEDLYHQPGYFVTAPNQFGRDTLLFSKDRSKLYLSGEGYSPEGNKPFLDEYDMKTGKTSRLWRADGVSTYETVVKVLDLEKSLILTSIESPKVYPNLYIRDLTAKTAPRPVTFNQNPYLPFEKVTKQKIFYKRNDGVELSATLYLPPGYDSARDGRLPVLMEAYPVEYKDKAAAGMTPDSPHQFIYLYWGSPVFWAVRGYAVLEGAQFPIVGQGKEEPNDTFIEQLVENARAAIQAVDSRGVGDPKRVAVMGHSYGAFMTANLLAHCDLFAAGIARSGAYNRSLTPFGFQSEERSYWEAKEVYHKMSPFDYAGQIKNPLLLIHGDADNNPGTFTLQSERLFQAIKGLGGTARLVLLPYESHGYAARENILHMLWEMDTWLEKYVKNRQ